MEVWKDIEGYEGLYQVSDLGHVRSVDRINDYGRKNRGRERRQNVNTKTGYCYVTLSKNGRIKNHSVHRLVAKAFIDNPEHKETVNHINENKQDNRACNLEWMSLVENLRYGTHDQRVRENKPCMVSELHPNYGKRGSETVTNKGPVIGISVSDFNEIIRFDTAATAARELNLSSGCLCDAINGRRKSCGGYYWRRENG